MRIFESQYTLNQCKDKNYCLLWRGEDFHTGAMFEIYPFPFLSKCKKRAVKRAVLLCKLMLVFSLTIFTSCFVDQSYARLFVEFNIRASPLHGDKLTFFSKYALACWRTGSHAPADSVFLLVYQNSAKDFLARASLNSQ